jgi:hypothetical protein
VGSPIPLAFSNSVWTSKKFLSGEMIGSDSVSMEAVLLRIDTSEASFSGETVILKDSGESSKEDPKESTFGRRRGVSSFGMGK